MTSNSVEREVVARDREIDNPFTKDLQVTAIHGARPTSRTASRASPRRTSCSTRTPARSSPSSCTSSRARRSAACRPISTRRVLHADGEPLPGLYAAGEVAGFGGGGMHGYRALEGTFLGGCLFSGRTAGRALAAARSLARPWTLC